MNPRIICFWLSLLGCVFGEGSIVAQNAACGQAWLEKDWNPAIIQQKNSLVERLNAAAPSPNESTNLRDVINIPVVVHVVWHGEEENLSDVKILDQIQALNRDFNAENEDLAKLPAEFEPFVAQKGIQFYLAAEDPEGLPTSGIVRKQTSMERIGTSQALYFDTLGGSNAWAPDRYLNIWVANVGPYLTGFGTFPGLVDAEKQGVVIHSKYFGPNQSSRYNLGRVLVHEIGHFLGLEHIWGDAGDCEMDDQVSDTPLQQSAYTDCPTYPQHSCGSSNMFMNYMDYVDDDCMIMFSLGQMERMQNTLELFRPGLLQSQIPGVKSSGKVISVPFKIYPNPATTQITLDFQEPVAELGMIEIFTAQGVMVYAQKVVLHNQMTLELPILSPGIYVLRIGNLVQKLVIQ